MKHTCKKILAWTFVLLMLLSVVSCTTGNGNTEIDSTVSTNDNTGTIPGSNLETPPQKAPVEEPVTPKNLIIIIGDGMGPEHITAGQLYSGRQYDFTDWQQVAVNTNSIASNGYATPVTDSSAAATALATGKLTINGYVGIDQNKRELDTILDAAAAQGKLTGIVTTDNLYGGTPAGFSAHVTSRSDYEAVITSQLASDIDFLCGQTNATYAAKQSEIADAGYTYCDNFSKRDDVLYEDKLLCQFDIDTDNGSGITLAQASEFAIEFLSNDSDGFVLMIEQAHIDKKAHNNNFEAMAKCVNSLADTVEAVMAFASERDDTVVLVTSDHETGGLNISADATKLANKYTPKSGKSFSYQFTTGDHTENNVMLFVWGISPNFADYKYYKSSHLIKNTDIFAIMEEVVYAYERD